jgi:hypothetical protein
LGGRGQQVSDGKSSETETDRGQGRAAQGWMARMNEAAAAAAAAAVVVAAVAAAAVVGRG